MYQDAGDVLQQYAAGDAVTSPPNKYEQLQKQYLHLPELRNAVSAYCELAPNGARR